jgi:hypothetical protein
VSALRTYGPHHPILHQEPALRLRPLKPGDWVTHGDYGGTGIIVGRTNDELTVLWSEEPREFTFSLPNVRRVNMQSIAKQMIQVQPMPMPSGSVFYLDYKYSQSKLDTRCSTGPWPSKMVWRLVRCMSTLTRSSLSSLWSCWRSLSLSSATSESKLLAAPPRTADNAHREPTDEPVCRG